MNPLSPRARSDQPCRVPEPDWHIGCNTHWTFPDFDIVFVDVRAYKGPTINFGVERFEPDGQNADENDRDNCSCVTVRDGFDDLTTFGKLAGKSYNRTLAYRVLRTGFGDLEPEIS
jgi:hypothetical protein